MNLESKRQQAVTSAISEIKDVLEGEEPDRPQLAEIKRVLLRLAERKDLFSDEVFPPPGPGEEKKSCLYRLAEDDDGRFALYINAANGKVDAPPHNHTTWAVIVGIEGRELNRIYERTPDGPEVQEQVPVERGTGVAFLGDDVHSIHIDGSEPVINFHMYGIALEEQKEREFWSASKRTWVRFPAHSDIREARR